MTTRPIATGNTPSRPNRLLSHRVNPAAGSNAGGGFVSITTVEDTMSAQQIFDTAPLGALVRYSDGTARPPERFRKKLAAWENTNSGGRLVRKTPARLIGNHPLAASITLHKGDFGSAGVIVLVVHQTFSVRSSLTFELVDTPAIGVVRILDHAGPDAELLHLAADCDMAEAWLAAHRHPGAVFDVVTACALANATGTGRDAA
jgi:hypothetical protein